jgi:hypothetical protein
MKPVRWNNKKAQGRQDHPPTGLSRVAQLPPALVPTCVGTSALLRNRLRAIRWYDLYPNPDGAPLCPVAYPLCASFLVTATTGDGAFPPVALKCRPLEDACQARRKFSWRAGNPRRDWNSPIGLCKYRHRRNPPSNDSRPVRARWRAEARHIAALESWTRRFRACVWLSVVCIRGAVARMPISGPAEASEMFPPGLSSAACRPHQPILPWRPLSRSLAHAAGDRSYV